MDKAICLDENYSTTRVCTKEKPILEQKFEYKLEPKLFLSPNSERKGEGGLRTKDLFKKSYDNKPLISVVTVVYNGEKHLEQTINSVLDQDYDNVEYIVIDGGSTDGTLDIIKKYGDKIDYWVSEPDGGIYNAMNKGISLCTGAYVAFLNADDWYNIDALINIVKSNQDDYDYIFGNVTILDINSTYLKTMTFDIDRYKNRMPIGHPALFVKRDLLLKLGFDEIYTFFSDYDFVIKLIEGKYTYSYLPIALTNFRLGGASSVLDNYQIFHIQNKHFGLLHAIYWYLLRTENLIILKLLKILDKFVIFLRKKKNNE